MRTNPVIVAILLPVALAWVLLRATARALARALRWSFRLLGSVLRRAWTVIGPPIRRITDVLAQAGRVVVRVLAPVNRLLARAIGHGIRVVGRVILAAWRLVRPAVAATWRGVALLVRRWGSPMWRVIRFTSLAVTVPGVLLVSGSVLLLAKPLEVALGLVIALVRPLAAAIAVAAGIVMGAFRAAVAALRAVVGLGGQAEPDARVAATGGAAVADRRLTASFLVHVLLASALLGIVGAVRDQLSGGDATTLLAIVVILHASGAAYIEQYGRALSAFLVAAVAVGIAMTPTPELAGDPLGAALSLAVPGLLLFLAGGIVGEIGGDELTRFGERLEAEEKAKQTGSAP